MDRCKLPGHPPAIPCIARKNPPHKLRPSPKNAQMHHKAFSRTTRPNWDGFLGFYFC